MACRGARGLNCIMFSRQYRFLARANASLVVIWLVAWGGHRFLENHKMTAEKVRAYVETVNFSELTGAARAKALKDLEDMLNALPYQERQRLRGEHLMNDWLAKMTDEEKAQFIEATMPTGFKKMISAFEQMPDEKRKRIIDDAMKNLRSGKNRPTAGASAISPELEAKIRTIGLNAFYSQSSAQTKAELAPFLEELQRQMESGRRLRQQ